MIPPMPDALISACAVAFVIVTAGAVCFQIALAIGMPWGRYAMGGAHPGTLPPRLRVAAVAQAVVRAALAAVVAARAGLIDLPILAGLTWPIWLVVAIAAVSLVLNALSRSAGERRVWVPVAIVLLATSLIVAIGGG
jgi:hypothetical protein